MEQYLIVAASAFIGGVASALLIIPKALADRETHSSNRILEVRLNALQGIWDCLNELTWLVSPSLGMGYEKWHEAHYDAARQASLDFKKEVERQQIVLDKSVVDAFKKIYSAFDLFMTGSERDERHNKPQPYGWFLRERLNPRLDTAAEAINETMNVSTHQIALQFSDKVT